MWALPVLFLGYFFLYPLISILLTGLVVDGGLDLTPFSELVTRRSLLGVAWFTVWQAAVSTLLTLVLAMPGAYVLARYRFPGRSLVRALVTVPFVLPTVVVGTAFLAVLGPSGPLGIDLVGTVWAILIAHVFFNYAVVVRTVGGLWGHLDPRLVEAARVLGATRWQAFRRVTLPLLKPALTAAASIVFLFTFTSFGVVLILGDLRHATLEVEVYRQTTAFLDLPLAAALAIVQLVGVGSILAWYSRVQRRSAQQLSLYRSEEAAQPIRTRGDRLIVGAVLASMAVLLGGPLLVLMRRSLTASFGLDYYAALGSSRAGSFSFVAPAEAIANSLMFAIVATVIALAVGGTAAAIVAYGRGRAAQSFDVLLMLPLGTSAVTIGFGFLVAFDWPVDLRTSAALIPIAHAVVAVPFVVRTAVPVMRSVRQRLREAAAVLGAPPARVFRTVDLPIVSRALLVGAGFAFAVSLGEFGATTFVARPDTPTMPVLIFRFLGLPGALNLGQAMAMSTILMLVTATAILVIERARIGGLGDF